MNVQEIEVIFKANAVVEAARKITAGGNDDVFAEDIQELDDAIAEYDKCINRLVSK